MMVFSEQHAWQGDEGVQQILVFPTELAKDEFEVEIKSRIDEIELKNQYDEKLVSDSNAGAIYKCRAVKNSDDTWTACTRCGISGSHLWESDVKYITPAIALMAAIRNLHIVIGQAFSNEIAFLLNNQ